MQYRDKKTSKQANYLGELALNNTGGRGMDEHEPNRQSKVVTRY